MTDIDKQYPACVAEHQILPFLSTRELLRLEVHYRTQNLANYELPHEAILSALFSRHNSSQDIQYQMMYLQHANLALFRQALGEEKFRSQLKKAMLSPYSTFDHKVTLLKELQDKKIEANFIQHYYFKAIADAILWLFKSLTNIFFYVFHKFYVEFILLHLRWGNHYWSTAAMNSLSAYISKIDNSNAQRFVDSLLEKFNHQDLNIRLLALKTITSLLPKLKDDNAPKIMEHLLEKIFDDNFELREAALTILSKLLPKLKEEYIEVYFNYFLKKSKCHDDFISSNGLNALIVFLPKLKKQAIEQFINHLLVRLNNLKHWDDKPSYHALVTLLPKLNEQRIQILGDYILKAQESHYIRVRGLNLASALLPKLKYENIRSLIRQLLEILKSDNDYMLDTTLQNLRIFLPKFEEHDIQELINSLLQRFHHENNEAHLLALRIARVLLPTLQDEEIQKFISPLLNELVNGNWRVREAAFRTIVAILPKLNSKDCQRLIKPTIDGLNDNIVYIRQIALAATCVLVPKLKREDTAEFIEHLLGQLNTSYSDMHQSALITTISILPTLELQDAEKFIEPFLKELNNIRNRSYALNAMSYLSFNNKISLVSIKQLLLLRSPWYHRIKATHGPGTFDLSISYATEYQLWCLLDQWDKFTSISKEQMEKSPSKNSDKARRLRLFQEKNNKISCHADTEGFIQNHDSYVRIP